MGDTLRQVALGAYGLWLVAVVLVLASRYAGFPTLPGTLTGVVLGTVVFVGIGAVRLLRTGYQRFGD